ncbi:hypothetical protein L1887_26065 [Cichorium endivia]|nr:hypothetical protein L1887_26065 [Cichorium endivia]
MVQSVNLFHLKKLTPLAITIRLGLLICCDTLKKIEKPLESLRGFRTPTVVVLILIYILRRIRCSISVDA